MLDVARTPYPLSYLKDVIRTMAWYKMNDLHLVINNNYIFHEHYVDNGHDPFKESYAAFRLESKMKGKDGTPLTAKDLFIPRRNLPTWSAMPESTASILFRSSTRQGMPFPLRACGPISFIKGP